MPFSFLLSPFSWSPCHLVNENHLSIAERWTLISMKMQALLKEHWSTLPNQKNELHYRWVVTVIEKRNIFLTLSTFLEEEKIDWRHPSGACWPHPKWFRWGFYKCHWNKTSAQSCQKGNGKKENEHIFVQKSKPFSMQISIWIRRRCSISFKPLGRGSCAWLSRKRLSRIDLGHVKWKNHVQYTNG